MQFENQRLGSKRGSAGNTCWCRTWMLVEMESSVDARAQRRRLPRLLVSTRLHKPCSISVGETKRACNATKQLWQSAHSRHGNDDIRVLGAIVSFKTSRRRVVQISQPVMCDSCERSISSFQGCLFSESGQSQFQRGQSIRTGCLVMIGIERWESYDGNKLGHFCKDCSVYKKRTSEKWNKPKGERVETTAVVQRVMVETLEYEDGMLTENRSGFVSELTTRGTTPSLSPISRSSIEQRGFNTLIESSRLFPVMSVLSLKMNGTSVAFTCSSDYDPSRQPRPLLQSAGVSLLTDQTRSGTCWMQANWQVTVEANRLWTSWLNFQWSTMQEDGTTSSDVAEPVTDYTEVYKTTKESVSVEQGQLLRAAEPDICIESENAATKRYCRIHTLTAGRCVERTLMICIGDNKIQIWRTHCWTESILPLRPEWTKFWWITTMERLQWQHQKSHWAHGPSRSR